MRGIRKARDLRRFYAGKQGSTPTRGTGVRAGTASRPGKQGGLLAAKAGVAVSGPPKDRVLRKLDAENDTVLKGLHPQCPSVASPVRCMRYLGHVGCHFSYFSPADPKKPREAGTMWWSDKGKRLGAAFPRKTSTPKKEDK